MLNDTRESLGSHSAHEIIAYFSMRFAISAAHQKALYEAIEEWWFVPRSTETRIASVERVGRALAQYACTGALIDEYRDAYLFAISDRNATLESRLSVAHPHPAAA